jgi:hypothetical protein
MIAFSLMIHAAQTATDKALEPAASIGVFFYLDSSTPTLKDLHRKSSRSIEPPNAPLIPRSATRQLSPEG